MKRGMLALVTMGCAFACFIVAFYALANCWHQHEQDCKRRGGHVRVQPSGDPLCLSADGRVLE
jgi:hypothetical protein